MRAQDPGPDARGDAVYQPDAPDDGEIPEYEGIRDPEDTLIDRGADPYDEGASPPERPLAVDREGTTPLEQRTGAPLDRRLVEEQPDTDAFAGELDNGIGDLPGGAGELRDHEVGADRAGRLVAPDEGAHEDEEKDLLADDVGIAGAAASAEEAAVHVVPGPGEDEYGYDDIVTPGADEGTAAEQGPGTEEGPPGPRPARPPHRQDRRESGAPPPKR